MQKSVDHKIDNTIGNKGEEDIQTKKKKIHPNNKLNDLTGTEWIKFTKSWTIHKPQKREEKKTLHPACFPETLVQEYIEFFTKEKQVVLDPFLGTGSTLIACRNSNRYGIGIEIMEKYVKIAKERLQQITLNPNIWQKVFVGDSIDIIKIFKENSLPPLDYCITSPPYWNQLKRSYIRQKKRGKAGLDTKYGEHEKDIGNIDDYLTFLFEQKKIFDNVYEVMKNKGYLTIITNNVFADGRLYPLAFDTARALSEKWVLKDEKIWLQNDKPLIPLGVYSAWVGNRHHQYCLIFRKEE